MNQKNIIISLHRKIEDWIGTLPTVLKKSLDEGEGVIVAGGAIVSLIDKEKPNDYDVYIKNSYLRRKVIKHYMDIVNKITREDLEQNEENGLINFMDSFQNVIISGKNYNGDDKYMPLYISKNAISLTGGIQIITRFVGDWEEIVDNFDFQHTKQAFVYNRELKKCELNLNVASLICISNKEMLYSGSKYPLCSFFRTRKFLKRGWTISAGEMLKIALNMQEFNLYLPKVFEDQVMGVDSTYLQGVINYLRKEMGLEASSNLDSIVYKREDIIKAINAMFNELPEVRKEA